MDIYVEPLFGVHGYKGWDNKRAVAEQLNAETTYYVRVDQGQHRRCVDCRSQLAVEAKPDDEDVPQRCGVCAFKHRRRHLS